MKVKILPPQDIVTVDIDNDINVKVKPTINVEIVNSNKEKLNFKLNMRKALNGDLMIFDHKDIDKWRQSLSSGISYLDKDTNLIIKGGIDDVWFDLDNKKLVVVDYKAQSNSNPVEPVSYLENQYHQGYKRQMDIYVHILRNMKFDVSDRSYFLVCNGEKTPEKFDKKIEFTTTLIPYDTDTSWVSSKIVEMKKTLESSKIPEYNINCESCIYLASSKTI